MVGCFIVLVETVLSGETLNLVSIDIQDNPTRYKWVSGESLYDDFDDLIITVT